MDLTNASYRITLRSGKLIERYRRDRSGWRKRSTRRRLFRLSAEQVLNHLLPVLAGLRPSVTVEVDHVDRRATRRRHTPSSNRERTRR